MTKQLKTATVIVTKSSISRVDGLVLNHDLMSAEWNEVFIAMTVHDQWQASLTQFLSILDDHAHLKNLTIWNPTALPLCCHSRYHGQTPCSATTARLGLGIDSLQRLGTGQERICVGSRLLDKQNSLYKTAYCAHMSFLRVVSMLITIFLLVILWKTLKKSTHIYM